MKNSAKNIFIYLTLFLSLYGPSIYGNIYLYQLFIILGILYYLPLNIKKSITKTTLISLILLVIIMIIFISSVSISLFSDNFIITLASIGGLEAYMEIFTGLFFGYILYKQGITVTNFEYFILFILMPIGTISIIFYSINPDITMSIINNYLYGVSNTGQWRFSGFYGLPYYAAIGYLLFLFVIIMSLQKNQSKLAKFYLYISFIIIFIGGLLAASKTFLIGIFILLIVFVIENKKPLKAFFKVVLTSILVFILINSILFQNNDNQFSKIFNLLSEHSVFTMYDAVKFRYSNDNDAIVDVLSDPNWNLFLGAGNNVKSIATDSQYRDVIYRFGYIGFLFFIIFIFIIYWKVSVKYKYFVIILAIGSLGSNCFTPIGSTLIIWTFININILENINKKLTKKEDVFYENI